MATNSAIEWTDTTWNPVAGCSVVSAGCTNCYAMTMAHRLALMGMDKYKGLTRKSGKRAVWTGVVREHPAALHEPLRWKKPRNVFVNSMSDLFHEHVSDAFIRNLWGVMQQTPQHNYQILTKRPERMVSVVSNLGLILPNVWLGTSVEGRDVIDRITPLQRTPACIRFISFEPLIADVGAVDLSGIHWAIVGGESGQNARPIREQWVDNIHNQCTAQNVAFFFKQWGAWGADNTKRSKKANGREYRGKNWDEMPDNTAVQI